MIWGKDTAFASSRDMPRSTKTRTAFDRDITPPSYRVAIPKNTSLSKRTAFVSTPRTTVDVGSYMNPRCFSPKRSRHDWEHGVYLSMLKSFAHNFQFDLPSRNHEYNLVDPLLFYPPSLDIPFLADTCPVVLCLRQEQVQFQGSSCYSHQVHLKQRMVQSVLASVSPR